MSEPDPFSAVPMTPVLPWPADLSAKSFDELRSGKAPLSYGPMLMRDTIAWKQGFEEAEKLVRQDLGALTRLFVEVVGNRIVAPAGDRQQGVRGTSGIGEGVGHEIEQRVLHELRLGGLGDEYTQLLYRAAALWMHQRSDGGQQNRSACCGREAEQSGQDFVGFVHGVAPGSEPAPASIHAKTISFAELMGRVRALFSSEVKAARALMIAPSTMNAYCEGKSLPTPTGIRRLAPILGMSVDNLTTLVDAQREQMQHGEAIKTVAPVRRRVLRSPIRRTIVKPAKVG